MSNPPPPDPPATQSGKPAKDDAKKPSDPPNGSATKDGKKPNEPTKEVIVFVAESTEPKKENKAKSIKMITERLSTATSHVLSKFGRHLPFHDDEDDAAVEKHKKTIPTHQRGKIHEETPAELCEADCNTRGLIHTFGCSAILFGCLCAVKTAIMPGMSPQVLYLVPLVTSVSINFLLTNRCRSFCGN